MEHPSLAVCLVSPEREFGQSIIDLRNESLVVLDLAITHPNASTIRIPFTSSVQSRAQIVQHPLALHCRWRGCRSSTLLEGVCVKCERKAKDSNHDPSILDFHAESDSVPVVDGLVRIGFTITCPWTHLSPNEDEDANLEVLLTYQDTSPSDQLRITLPYLFLIEKIGTDEGHTAATRSTDPWIEDSVMISDSQPTRNTTGLVDPQQPARLSSHRGIAFVQESFPDTFQLFEDLAEGNLPLEQSVKGILVGMRTGGSPKQVINHTNEAGQTLAHLVGLYGPTSLWEELPMLGIDLNIVDSTDHTAIDYALANKTIQIPRRELFQKGSFTREMAYDLALLYDIFMRSPWRAEGQLEPRIGDSECPDLANKYGVRGHSCFTAFMDQGFKCRFDGCFRDGEGARGFTTLANAIHHQRSYHFR